MTTIQEKMLLQFGGGGIEKFTAGDNAFLDEFEYDQIGYENLLKAPDDLTNLTYWQRRNGASVVDEGSGVFRIEDSTSDYAAIVQNMKNWLPTWARKISVVVELLADTLDEAYIGLFFSSGGGDNIVDDVEVLSGPGSIVIGSSRGWVTDLSTTVWTKVRVSGTIASSVFSTAEVFIYPGQLMTPDGNGKYIKVRNHQLILGDVPDEKPRPVNQETAYPMMAYRPNWRLTKDGSARCSVVDTEGLIWCGEATTIKVAPASGTLFDCNADFIMTTILTYEIGKTPLSAFRYSDGNNRIQWSAGAAGELKLDKRVGGSWTALDSEAGVFADGEKHVVRAEAVGSSIKIYVDDKLYFDVTETFNQTVAQGYTWNNLTVNDIKIVAESNPKAPGLIVAGPKSPVGYGDPGIWWTDTDGSALAAASGMAWLADEYVSYIADRLAYFSLDTGTSGLSGTEASVKADHNLLYAEGAYDDVFDALSVGVPRSLICLQRSGTHGYHYLDHDSGKQWKFIWPGEGAEVGGGAVYPAVQGSDQSLSLKRFAWLDLSSWVDGDFAEVTDSKSTPASGTPYTDDDGFFTEIDFTPENTKYVIAQFRYVDNNNTWQVFCSDSLALQIRKITLGATTNYLNEAAVFTDGVAANLKITGNYTTGAISVWVDNVLKYSGSTLTDHGGTSRITHVLATNDIELETYPHPALGLAVDRWVCPQSEEENSSPPDGLIYLRSVQVPASDQFFFFRGVAHDSSPYCYGLTISSAGNLFIKEYLDGSAPTRITALASFSDDDDISILALADYLELFVNGVSMGSYGSAVHQANAGAKIPSFSTGLDVDSIEFWQATPNMPFKL